MILTSSAVLAMPVLPKHDKLGFPSYQEDSLRTLATQALAVVEAMKTVNEINEIEPCNLVEVAVVRFESGVEAIEVKIRFQAVTESCFCARVFSNCIFSNEIKCQLVESVMKSKLFFLQNDFRNNLRKNLRFEEPSYSSSEIKQFKDRFEKARGEYIAEVYDCSTSERLTRKGRLLRNTDLATK